MNMMCCVDIRNGTGTVTPVRMRQVARPTHAANLPVKRDPNARVGKFEDMDAFEAEALLKALDEAFA